MKQEEIEISYEDIKEGMELEYEDFWHSGILSWRKGVVEIIDMGSHKEKVISFGNWEGRVIRPHRMYQVRLPLTTHQ